MVYKFQGFLRKEYCLSISNYVLEICDYHDWRIHAKVQDTESFWVPRRIMAILNFQNSLKDRRQQVLLQYNFCMPMVD